MGPLSLRDIVAAYNESIRELSREVERVGQPELLRDGLNQFVATAAVPAVFAGLQPAPDGTFVVAVVEQNAGQFAEHERAAIVGQALCECFAFVATHVQDALPAPIRDQAATRLGDLAELVSRTAPISAAPQPVAAPPPPAAPLFQPATMPPRRSVPTRPPAPLWLKVLTFALFFALVGAIALVTRKQEPVEAPAPAVEAKKKKSVVPPKPSHTTETEPSAAAPVATTGTIVTAPDQVGHRLYVDGKLIGDSPQRVEVTCGDHSVQFGGKGPVQKLTVKCGEELVVRLK